MTVCVNRDLYAFTVRLCKKRPFFRFRRIATVCGPGSRLTIDIFGEDAQPSVSVAEVNGLQHQSAIGDTSIAHFTIDKAALQYLLAVSFALATE
uniref:Uncharacterized protein n=1 Tax=Pristionchus pacificus TaxID=54126 RepID=A0A2A6C311_PRIPA|eukprot:PDM72565.1 hypothetical protein PRIPAC_38999 [Pristionchus pacificus]